MLSWPKMHIKKITSDLQRKDNIRPAEKRATSIGHTGLTLLMYLIHFQKTKTYAHKRQLFYRFDFTKGSSTNAQ